MIKIDGCELWHMTGSMKRNQQWSYVNPMGNIRSLSLGLVQSQEAL